MTVFLICSKAFYDKALDIAETLKAQGVEVLYPNCFHNPMAEQESKELGEQAHQDFKRNMFNRSVEMTKKSDAVLVLNYSKNDIDGYIGGATFLEMYDAYNLGKPIYVINEPDKNSIIYDEVCGFGVKKFTGTFDKN